MSNYATRKDVQEIVQKAVATDVQKIVAKAVTDLSEVIVGFAQQVDERFTKNEVEVAKLNTKADQAQERLDGFDDKLNRLADTLDAFLKRLDNNETNNLVRDNQFERLLEWAKKVSKKTGIPLEGF